jgi:AmmeMemoRadiSam system protein A
MLTPEDRERLRRIARETVDSWVRQGVKPSFEVEEGPLREPRGVFVTLRRDGRLRGCIGFIEGIEPLWEAVRDMAVRAAAHDPRFPPVEAVELEDLEIEISVLSPLEPLSDPADVEVGRHGLMVRRGPRSGLLLPQVPVEHGWDRETFLEQTCFKAGLPPGAWKDPGTVILAFEAEVF